MIFTPQQGKYAEGYAPLPTALVYDFYPTAGASHARLPASTFAKGLTEVQYNLLKSLKLVGGLLILYRSCDFRQNFLI